MSQAVEANTNKQRFKENFLSQVDMVRTLGKSPFFEDWLSDVDNDRLWGLVEAGIPTEVQEALGTAHIPTWQSLIRLKWENTTDFGSYLNLMETRRGARYAYCGSTGAISDKDIQGGLKTRKAQHMWVHDRTSSVHDQIRNKRGTTSRFVILFRMPPPPRSREDKIMFGRALCKVVETIFTFWLGCFDYIQSEAVEAEFYNLSACSPLFSEHKKFTWLGTCSHNPLKEGVMWSAVYKKAQIDKEYAKWQAMKFEDLPAAAKRVWTPTGIPDEETRASAVGKAAQNSLCMQFYHNVYRGNLSKEDRTLLAAAAQRYRDRQGPMEKKLVRKRSGYQERWAAGKIDDEEYRKGTAECDAGLAAIRKDKTKPKRAAWGTYRRTAWGARKARSLA